MLTSPGSTEQRRVAGVVRSGEEDEPGAALDHPYVTAVVWTTPRPQVVIRRHHVMDVDLSDMVRLGTLDSVLPEFLRAGLRAGKNIVVTGLLHELPDRHLRCRAGSTRR